MPSEVASAGIFRPLFVNSGKAPTSEGPKSDTMTSIFGYLAMAAERTFCDSAGSQFVTSNGSLADELVLARGVEDLVETLVLLDALAVALRSAEHEHVAALRQYSEIHLPQFSPAWVKGVSMKTL